MSDLIEEPTTTTTTSNSSISNSNSNSNKRQRLSSTGEYNQKVPVQGSPVGSMAAGMTIATNTNRSRHHGIAAVTGLERTTTTAFTTATSRTTKHTTTRHTLPTLDQLAQELCKIVDTTHYSRTDAKRALANISRWGYTGDEDDDEDAANSHNSNSTTHSFLRDFSELGGIQRVLLFLQHNQRDPSCVMVAMKVIMACTHRPCEHPSYTMATEITRSFIRRQGIEIVLTAGKEFIIHNENENDQNQDTQLQQLHAVRWIWMVLMNVTEKISTFEIAEKKQLLAIFASFLQTMTQLGLRNNNAVTTTATVATTANNNNKMVVSPKKSHDDGSTNIGNTTGRRDRAGSESATDSSLTMNIVQRAISSFCSPTTTAPRKRSFMETTTPATATATAQEDEQHPQQGGGREVDHIPATATSTTVTTTTTTVNSNTSKQEEERDVVTTKLTALVLEDMFITLLNVTHHGRMTRQDFHGMDLISKLVWSIKPLFLL